MSQWHACYDSNWKGLIVDEAFAHPAKIAHGLVARIYNHAFEMGWLRAGDTVLDPFGGIGGTALYAATYGVRWVGVELEPRFHALAQQNFALWKRQMGHWPDWVEPTMLCGDSRRLCELVGGLHERTNISENEEVLSSPPYAENEQHGRPTKRDKEFFAGRTIGVHGCQSYGETEGQLGRLKEGSLDSVISSPPYAESIKGEHGETETAQESRDKRKTQGGSLGQSQRHGGYGVQEGQLGAMPEGAVEAVVSSPPWENQEPQQDKQFHAPHDSSGNLNGASYGATQGQLGNSTGDTFWAASRQIVEQCHKLLRPGGHAIWVVKDYVKAKKIVPFCDNWRRLCESVGFKTVCQHRAMLVKDLGEETNLFEPPKRRTKERKSFFRRLAEKKGSPRIDYEMVICMVKEGGGGAADCVVSSPPFQDHRAITGRDQDSLKDNFSLGVSNYSQNEYGTTPGQLGSMKEGKAP